MRVVVDIMTDVFAIVRERPLQPLAQRNTRRPPGCLLEARRVGVEAPDIDRFLLGWPLDEGVPPAARDVYQQLHQIAMRDVIIPANVERLSVAGVTCAGTQERLHGIIY